MHFREPDKFSVLCLLLLLLFNGLLDKKPNAAVGLNYRFSYNIDGTNNISRNYTGWPKKNGTVDF